MTQAEFQELASGYEQQTGFHSFAHMMRRTPAYLKLIAAGEEIVPWIIHGFESHLRNQSTQLALSPEVWGMEWITLLMDITRYSPVQPEPVKGGGFMAWNVDAVCRAWIDWYRKQGKEETDNAIR